MNEGWGDDSGARADAAALSTPPPVYTAPRKRWRIKRAAVPQWYKVRTGQRQRVQSAAARVARHRPRSSAA